MNFYEIFKKNLKESDKSSKDIYYFMVGICLDENRPDADEDEFYDEPEFNIPYKLMDENYGVEENLTDAYGYVIQYIRSGVPGTFGVVVKAKEPFEGFADGIENGINDSMDLYDVTHYRENGGELIFCAYSTKDGSIKTVVNKTGRENNYVPPRGIIDKINKLHSFVSDKYNRELFNNDGIDQEIIDLVKNIGLKLYDYKNKAELIKDLQFVVKFINDTKEYFHDGINEEIVDMVNYIIKSVQNDMLNESEDNSGVTVISNGSKFEFNSMDEAKKFWTDCVYNSEGSEQNRYVDILGQLEEGKTYVSDGSDDRVPSGKNIYKDYADVKKKGSYKVFNGYKDPSNGDYTPKYKRYKLAGDGRLSTAEGWLQFFNGHNLARSKSTWNEFKQEMIAAGREEELNKIKDELEKGYAVKLDESSKYDRNYRGNDYWDLSDDYINGVIDDKELKERLSSMYDIQDAIVAYREITDGMEWSNDSDEIKEVSSNEISDFISKWGDDNSSVDTVRLYAKDTDGRFVAVDNRSGDCWVEEFPNKEDAMAWLNDEFEMSDYLEKKNDINEADEEYKPNGVIDDIKKRGTGDTDIESPVELNTGVLPIVNVDCYSRQELIWSKEESMNDVNGDGSKILEPGDEGYYEITTEMLDENIMAYAPSVIEEYICEVLPGSKVTPIKMYHPRQYNFGGDELEFKVDFDTNKYKEIEDAVVRDGEFKEFLKKYSSHSGFFSYMADDIDEFMQQDFWKRFVQVIMFCLRNLEDDMEDSTNTMWENIMCNL